MLKTGRELIDRLGLAWLIRADLRAGRSTKSIPEDFCLWWATCGRMDYPDFAIANSLEALDLFTPLPEWPSYGRFGMSRLLKYLVGQREDLQQAFDIATEQGLWHGIAWLFTHGLREYSLANQVDHATRAALDETPPFLVAPADTGSTNDADITWLMFFVWRCDENLQTTFDLCTQQGKATYLTWFFCEGVPRLALTPLISMRWRKWLLTNLSNANVPGVVLPRMALLMWLRRPDLQSAFDIRLPAGWNGIAQWATAAWQSEEGMKWLIPEEAESTGQVCPPDLKRRPFGLNLIGFAFGELGIGEDVRMAVAACEAAGIPFKVVNINPGSQLRQADRLLEAHVGQDNEDAPYAINLFCLTGFDTVRVYLERGLSLFGGRYNIGWWPWELPVWPGDWQIAFELVDEVWAATEFTQGMYTLTQKSGRSAVSAPTPVTLMPMAVSVARALPLTRRKFGLPNGKFLYLYVFDFNSYLDRKNPFALLKAFRRAFPVGDASVGLVLKTMNSNPQNRAWQRFLKECAKDKRIVALEKTLDRGEVLGLIEACDAYVSLHRSEGFGRTLAEAMLFGKPVVGTDFSGNVDFLKSEVGFPVKWKRRPVKSGEYPFVTEADAAWWAEPDIADAARQMQAARMAAEDKTFAQRVRSFAQQQFAPECIGTRMRQRLDAIAPIASGGTC